MSSLRRYSILGLLGLIALVLASCATYFNVGDDDDYYYDHHPHGYYRNYQYSGPYYYRRDYERSRHSEHKKSYDHEREEHRD
jgi:hypothetical protein